MIAIIRWVLTKRLDVELFLIFANKTEADIIFREEWDRTCASIPTSTAITCSNSHPRNWTMGVGWVTADMLRTHLPAPGPDTIVFLCGPRRWWRPGEHPQGPRLFRGSRRPAVDRRAGRRVEHLPHLAQEGIRCEWLLEKRQACVQHPMATTASSV